VRAGSTPRKVLAGLILIALTAAACGDDDDGTSAAAGTAAAATPTEQAATTAADGAVDPDGVLRVGQALSSATLFLDPTMAPAGIHRILYAIYGNLLVKTEDGSYEPSMATSVEVVDSRTIEVKLREGMTFSDGTPVDAEALKFNLERMAAAGNTRGLRAEVIGALTEVEVTGPLAATVHLGTPTAGAFYDLFAGPETALLSPSAIRAGQDMNAKPVGADPFVLESLQPDVKMVLEKNPDYWNADEVLLAGLEYIHVSPGPPVVTALRSGAIDLPGLSLSHSTAEELGDPFVVEMRPQDGIFQVDICKKDPPLSDVRVRQALAFAIDRERLAARLYGDEAEPAWGLKRSKDPAYNAELEGVYAHNPERARELLAEAGYPDGFSTSMIVSEGTSSVAGEILQAQWSEVGVEVELITSPSSILDFYLETKAPMYPVAQSRAGIDGYTVRLLPGAFANVCDYSNPEIQDVVAEVVAAAPGSAEATEAWQRLSTLVAQELPILPIVFHSEALAHNGDRVGGVTWLIDEIGIRMPNLEGIYIKA